MKKYFGEGALLFNTLIWGGTFALIKSAFEDISPSLFLALRFSIATLLLLPFIFKVLRNVNKQTIVAGSILGIFYFTGFAAQSVGLNLINSIPVTEKIPANKNPPRPVIKSCMNTIGR